MVVFKANVFVCLEGFHQKGVMNLSVLQMTTTSDPRTFIESKGGLCRGYPWLFCPSEFSASPPRGWIPGCHYDLVVAFSAICNGVVEVVAAAETLLHLPGLPFPALAWQPPLPPGPLPCPPPFPYFNDAWGKQEEYQVLVPFEGETHWLDIKQGGFFQYWASVSLSRGA